MCQKYFAFILCLSFLSAVRAQVNCVTCDASTNETCITNPSEITAEACSTNTCYTQIESGVVTRGCTDSLNGTTCSGDDCVTCRETNCNALQTICQACNSSIDTTCAELNETNNDFNTICTTLSAQCYVGVIEDNTVRRCAETSDSCEEESTTCRLCTESNCNDFAFPETIENTTPKTTATTPTGSTRTTATTPTGSTRTTATTPAGSTRTTPAGTTATTPGGTPVTIKCIECSSANTTTCLGTPASIAGTDCPGGVCYQAWEDNVYYRGCLSTAESTLSTLCSGNSEQCKTCTTNLCNVEVVNAAATTHLTLGLIISVALLACGNAL